MSAAKNFFRFPRGQAFYVCLTEPLRIGEMVEFLKNRKFLDALIEFDWRYVCYLDKTFKNDKTLVLAILSKLKSLEEARALLNFLADEPVLYEIISVIKVKFRLSSYKELFEDYEKDRENNLPYLKALLGSFDAAFEAIKLSSENIKYIPDSLRIQKEFILQAIQINPQVFEIAQESLKKEEDFVFEAIARNLQVISFVDPVMLAAQPLIVRIVQSYGDLLDQDEFIKLVEQRTGLLANKVEISLFLRALIIVHQNPMDYKRVDVSLKQNPQLLHFFLEHSRFNLDDLDHQGVCSEYIKNWIRIFKDPMAIFQIKIDDIDHKLFLHALNSFCDQRRNLEGFEQGLESFKELKKNPRLPPMIYFLAITGNQTAKGESLQIEDLHAQYPSDRDVVYPILKRDLSQFCKLSSSLKSDRQFVLKLLKGQGRLTQDSDLIMKEVPHFRNDLLFMIEATKIYPFCVHYISDKLVERLDFIDLAIARGAYGVLAHKKFSKNKRLFLEIMKKNPEVAQYAHVDLQSDPEFLSKMKRPLEERVASEGFPPL